MKMTKTSVFPIIALAMTLSACHESSTSLVTDTGSDTWMDPGSDTAVTDPGVDPTVPSCEDVPDWDLLASETSGGSGTVTVQVDLESAGVTSGCAGSPCLIVTVAAGDGTVSEITQVSASRATFVYSDPGAASGDEAQLLLRWRVLCSQAGGEEERTVTSPVWICAGTGGDLTVSDTSC